MLLSPGVLALLLGYVYPIVIMAGLIVGGLLFLHLLHTVNKPTGAFGKYFAIIVLSISWGQLQPRDLSFWALLLVGLQCGFLVAFVYTWLCYLCRETVARRAAANRSAS
jgi:hypothetical protein